MIVIHPHAQKMRNGMPNAKNFPYWPQLITLLDADVIQIGVEGEEELPLVQDFRQGLKLKEVRALLEQCDYWVSVDSFLPHLAHHIPKAGVVIYGVSDPTIFGYPENLNVLKDRKFLRASQFSIWEEQSYSPEPFLGPKEIAKAIEQWAADRVIAPKLHVVSG